MDRLVALQHPYGFIDLEPLPLPSCEEIQVKLNSLHVAHTISVVLNDTSIQCVGNCFKSVTRPS